MNSRTDTVLISASLVVFLLIGGFWQPSKGDLGGYLSNANSLLSGYGSSLFSSFSQDKGMVVALADDDSEDSDSDNKDDSEGPDKGGDRLEELWDSVMLG